MQESSDESLTAVREIRWNGSRVVENPSVRFERGRERGEREIRVKEREKTGMYTYYN